MLQYKYKPEPTIKEIIASYLNAIVFCSLVIIGVGISYFIPRDKMIHKQLTLSSDPYFVEEHGSKGHIHYRVDFYFKEIDGPLNLSGREYKKDNHPYFIDGLHADTVLTIDYTSRRIQQITQNGQTCLTDLKLVALRERHNYVYGLVFLFTALLNCVVPLLLRHKMGENLFREYSLHYIVFLLPITIGIALLITYHIFDVPFGVAR